MKAILNVVAISAVIALCGCNHNKTSANMGAVDDTKSNCCTSGKSSGCCSDKSKSTSETSTNGTNMGAVSDQKTSTGGCCAAHKSTSGN